MAVHRLAGAVYGQESACGKKVRYSTETSATKAAEAMTRKRADGKKLEGYPCFWCERWHVGRAMSAEEFDAFVRLLRTYGGNE